MGKIILIFLFCLTAHADIFDFVTGGDSDSRLQDIAEKISKLSISETSQFEDQFNLLVKRMDEALDQRKLFCQGEASDDKGKSISPEKRADCFKQLKKDYFYALEQVLEVKKKYLAKLHQTQIKKLEDSHQLLKQSIDKNFQ